MFIFILRPLLQSWHLDDALLATCLKVSEAAGAMPMCYTANGIWTCDTTDKDVQTMNFKNAEGESALEWWARVGEVRNFYKAVYILVYCTSRTSLRNTGAARVCWNNPIFQQALHAYNPIIHRV